MTIRTETSQEECLVCFFPHKIDKRKTNIVSNNAKKIKPNDTITNTSDAFAYETWIIDSLIPPSRKTVVRIIVISSAIRSAMLVGSMKKPSQDNMTSEADGMYTAMR